MLNLAELDERSARSSLPSAPGCLAATLLLAPIEEVVVNRVAERQVERALVGAP